MSFRYVWEKSHEAVRSLALSDEPLATRLARSLDALLRLQSEADFGSGDARRHFEELVQQFGGSDTVATTTGAIERLDNDALHRAAESILLLYSEVEREHGRRHGPS
ncbi:hypothetical protein [Egicoccus sp. AB-alg2]|uniref:hypothetical protein n=1 Tax=Egicoccus sp. AB-alg2 TaxID=3242693 RepID=UPI00359E42BB